MKKFILMQASVIFIMVIAASPPSEAQKVYYGDTELSQDNSIAVDYDYTFTGQSINAQSKMEVEISPGDYVQGFEIIQGYEIEDHYIYGYVPAIYNQSYPVSGAKEIDLFYATANLGTVHSVRECYVINYFPCDQLRA